MKYSVETTDDGCLETLELDSGTVFTKKSHYEGSSIKQDNRDFSEQLEEAGYEDEKILDEVNSLLDGFFAVDFLDLRVWF